MKTAYRKWIARKLQELRHKRNFTQFDVAFKLQINESTYRAYEASRAEPSVMIIKEVCKIYKLTLDQFLKDSPEFITTAKFLPSIN